MSKDTDQYDLFVSYARADDKDGWVTGFIQKLLAEHRAFSGNDPARELKPFFDTQVIGSFDDWQHRIYDGLSKSRLFIAFLSPAYFASEWCRREWKAWIDTEIAKHILSEGATPIYFVEVPGFVGKVPGLDEQRMLSEQEVARKVAELCGVPEPHDDLVLAASPIIGQMRNRRQITQDFVKPFADEGLDALRREDLRQVLHHLAEDLDERIGRVRAAADSESNVPTYNRKFSGRLDELLDMRKRLKDDRAGVVCGVHGLGGIGKTELAFTYAHAFAHAYPGGRFLVRCENKASLREAAICLAGFKDFHAQISEEERKTTESLFAAVCRCLDRRLAEKGHILLVLDNVTDTGLVSRQQTDELTLLGPRLHLLATTRNLPPVGAQWLKLGQLPDADALDLLEKHRAFAGEEERKAAQRIVRRLGGFTLAIELVAAWLAAHPGSTYGTLVEGLGLEDLEQIAGDEDIKLERHNHERRLSAVLGPALAQLQPVERRVLEYAALLPPDHVALPWLRQLIGRDFPAALEPTRLVGDPWRELWGRLERLAFFSRVVEEDAAPRLLRVHRMVQDLVKRDLPETERLARQQAVDDLVRERDAALEKETRWQEARWELDPIEALAWLWAEPDKQKENAPPTHPLAAWLCNQAGIRFRHLADWTRAEPLTRCALAIDEQSFGKDHPEVAIHLNNLAQLLQDTNRLADAEPLMRRALAIDERSFGKDHPNVARDLNNLAQLLQDTNRLADAEPLMRRALAIDEQSFGKDHPKVAICLNNLAVLLQDTNRLADAEPLVRRALAIFESSLGGDHPNVATQLNNLALLLQDTNRLADAEPLMRRALAIWEGSLGEDHPNVASALNNLAQLLQATNRLAEAEPLMRRALAIDEQSFGKDHPKVARDLNNLAQLLQATNRLADAEPLMRRALAIDERSFGKDHPNVARDLNNLALLLTDTNRLADAEPLMRRALAIDEQSFGKDHPKVARDLNNLAQLLQATNRLADAEPLMRRALAIDERSFGKDHPNVARDLNTLAQLLKATNRLADAEPLMRRAVETFAVSLGGSHPNTETVARNYAALLQAMGSPEAEIQRVFEELGGRYGLPVRGAGGRAATDSPAQPPMKPWWKFWK